MSVQQRRARWQREVRLTRALALMLAGMALVGIILLSLLWQLRLDTIIVGIVLGGLVCQLLVQAIEATHERLSVADIPQILRAQGYLGITVVLLLILALSLWGFAHIPNLMQPLLLGGFALVALYAAERVRETARPRHFVAIANDGSVLASQKGTLLLTVLEDAGYRLITQCGRQGSCASCRVRVREGAENWEEKHYGPILTPRQRREGWVLACQVPVESDLAIELFKPLVIRWPAPARGLLTEKARALRAVLPGFDCEACGYLTCEEYAQALAQGKAPPTRCLPGGRAVNQKLQEIARGSEGAR